MVVLTLEAVFDTEGRSVPTITADRSLLDVGVDWGCNDSAAFIGVDWGRNDSAALVGHPSDEDVTVPVFVRQDEVRAAIRPKNVSKRTTLVYESRPDLPQFVQPGGQVLPG